MPGRDSILEPDSEKLDDRNLYFSTVYIMSFLVATILLATLSRIVYGVLFALSKLPRKLLEFSDNIFSSKALILPICAAILTFNGAAAIIPLIFAEIMRMSYQVKKENPLKEKIFYRRN